MKGKKERIGRIVQMHANERQEITEVRAGDIAAGIGLKEVTHGRNPVFHRRAADPGAHGVPGAGDSRGR